MTETSLHPKLTNAVSPWCFSYPKKLSANACKTWPVTDGRRLQPHMACRGPRWFLGVATQKHATQRELASQLQHHLSLGLHDLQRFLSRFLPFWSFGWHQKGPKAAHFRARVSWCGAWNHRKRRQMHSRIAPLFTGFGLAISNPDKPHYSWDLERFIGICRG